MKPNTKPGLTGQRTALVTGAAGTLGRALSLELSRVGYSVALADTETSRLAEVRTAIEMRGGIARCELLDVTSPDSWRHLQARLAVEWPRLDVLVNNAGVLFAADFVHSDWETWRHTMDVNLLGTVLGCKVMGGWMCGQTGTSHVVNISSYTGFVPIPWSTAYTVSKAGVMALSEALAVEWAPHAVQVTVVCPGFFPSELFATIDDAEPTLAEGIRRLLRKSPLTAEQVARETVRGMRAGRIYVITPAAARWLWRLKRWLPGRFLRRLTQSAHVARARIRTQLQDAEGDTET